MRIFIITMDDPIHTKNFIKQIIDARSKDIVGLAIPKGDRLTLSKGKSKYTYILSLLLIMGITHFTKNVFISLVHKLRKLLFKFHLSSDPSLIGYAKKKGIPVFTIKTPNSKAFRDKLAALKPHIIINQSQSIIKRELLDIPVIGVINRHNALLPKNRGRLTPFWVAYRNEKEAGVSIHFVDEGIDSGPIIVQEKFSVSASDTFNSIVKKNYQIAPKAMLKAIEMIENGVTNFIPNPNEEATYNSTPSLKEAYDYRLNLIFRVGKYLSKM